MMDALDVLALLRQRCEEAGGQLAFAVKHDISQAYVCEVIAGHMSPGPKILNALGLRKVTAYLPVKPVTRAAE